MAYLSDTDLEDAIGVNTVKAIFDDDHDNVPDQRPMASCLAYATSECDAMLRALAPSTITLPLTSVPVEVKFAAVDFAVAYAYRRRPDVVSAMGAEPWKTYLDAARAKIDLFAKETIRLSATVGAAQTASALPTATDPPPGALGAGHVAFGTETGCVANEWIRKEGCG